MYHKQKTQASASKHLSIRNLSNDLKSQRTQRNLGTIAREAMQQLNVNSEASAADETSTQRTESDYYNVLQQPPAMTREQSSIISLDIQFANQAIIEEAKHEGASPMAKVENLPKFS